MSIKSVTILSTQKSVIDTSAIQKTDSGLTVAYKARLISDATNVNINFLLKKKTARFNYNIGPDFSMPTATMAELKLYNVQGKCVKTSRITALGEASSCGVSFFWGVRY